MSVGVHSLWRRGERIPNAGSLYGRRSGARVIIRWFGSTWLGWIRPMFGSIKGGCTSIIFTQKVSKNRGNSASPLSHFYSNDLFRVPILQGKLDFLIAQPFRFGSKVSRLSFSIARPFKFMSKLSRSGFPIARPFRFVSKLCPLNPILRVRAGTPTLSLLDFCLQEKWVRICISLC